jgi:glycosyltransferase involved in cell wall biosynthesis
MRILLINHEFSMSGASVMLLKLADHFARSGHDCEVVAGRPTQGPMEELYRQRGIPVRAKVAWARYDAAVCNTVFAGSVVLNAPARVGTIWWLHEAEVGREYLAQRPDIAEAFRRAKAIVFQSAWQRDANYGGFIGQWNPAGIFIVPNGTDVPRAGPAMAKSEGMRVICVGTLDRRKRQGDLIRAIHDLDRRDIECVLLGEQLYLGEEERHIAGASPDRFKNLGERPHDEILAWLRSADIFCLPSQSESQPLTLLEAGALGLPIVAADLAVYRGVWRHDVNALLYPVGDVAALGRALAQLAEDPALRRRLGDAAARTAADFTEARFFAGMDRALAAACA